MDILLKATKVDGIYDSDPATNPSANRYDVLSYQEALERQLGVMDLTALSMCMERNLPVVVFDFKQHGNIKRVIEGDPIGTLLTSAAQAAEPRATSANRA